MTEKRSIRVVAAVIRRGRSYLITQRRPTAVMPMMWEFPGGRVEGLESDEQALAREVQHRLGVGVEVGPLISFVSHRYDRYDVALHLYECSLVDGTPTANNVHDFAWANSEEFEQFLFTPADEASVAALLGLKHTAS